MKKLLILLTLLLCTACSALPAEERAFAVVLCIEKPGSLWQAHARIPTYQNGGGYQTVTGKGNSLDTALAALEVAAPMHLHLSQLRLVVLQMAVGRDAATALHTLSARMDIRPNCAVAVTEASAASLMEALEPASGMRLSKGLDVLLDTRVEQGSILPATLADIIRMGDRQTPVAAGLRITDGQIELSGGYALAEQIVPITDRETALLSLLRGDTKNQRLFLPDGTAEIRDAKSQIRLAGTSDASVILTLTAVESAFTPDDLEAQLAGELLTLLERLTKAGCDVLGLGRRAMMQMNDMAQWHVLNWPDRLRQLRWTVAVGVNGPA